MDTLKSRQCGFSLVELMLAMTLSLLVLAGLFRSVLGDLRSYESIRATEQLVAKSQLSLKSLKLYIMQAGFRDIANLKRDRDLEADTSTDWSWATEQSLQGLNAVTTGSFSGAKATSDIIALRFIGITSASSSSSDVIDCNGDEVSTDDEYEISLYVSQNDELLCKDTNGTTTLNEDIEHLHILYGLEDEYKYYSADQVSDWSLVDRVKVAVLISQSVSANYVTNNNDYQLFDRTISAANDTNFRQVATGTILIRN